MALFSKVKNVATISRSQRPSALRRLAFALVALALIALSAKSFVARDTLSEALERRADGGVPQSDESAGLSQAPPDALRLDSQDDGVITEVLGSLELDQLAWQLPWQLPAAAVSFDKEILLDDPESRVGEAFKIPAKLRDRVGFWFDIYTKYDSNRRLIHHADYPWIIFKVVDTTSIIEADAPRLLWMRREKADQHVKSEAKRVRGILRQLSQRKALAKLDPDEATDLSDDERTILRALRSLEGNPLKNAKRAAARVRVQTGQRNFFIDGLKTSGRYLPTMERIFSNHGLPTELTRLPLVESSFNKMATSKVGAAGIWQFMEETGRKFLLVSDSIDERRSPLKSTEAAALLLKESHMILRRSWPLAVSAWNHGPAGIRRAMESVRSHDLGDIVGRYRSSTFDFASSNFYSEFLAALYAERYSNEIFGDIERLEALDVKVVRLRQEIRFNKLAKMIEPTGLNQQEFLAINPDLRLVARTNDRIPQGFRMYLPGDSINLLQRLLVRDESRPSSPRS